MLLLLYAHKQGEKGRALHKKAPKTRGLDMSKVQALFRFDLSFHIGELG